MATQLIPVESSTIEAVGYNLVTRVLTVMFRSGASSQYDDVPLESHAAFMAAANKDTFYQRSIKPVFALRTAEQARSAPFSRLGE